jgi:gliding motility-associated-like protein
MKAQICDPTTPVYYVNLSGNPSGVWTSPSTPRAGYCCGAVAPDVCIEFVITLDSAANGIKFDIIAGAVPPGSLFYQVSCGPPVMVGQPLCLNGPGPHYLTFCKPGNNNNVYAITSLPKPDTDGSLWVSQACQGSLSVIGLIDTSIYWTSIPPNPLYNSFLSCMQDCDTVTVTPNVTNLPAYVDYQVCGYVVGGCIPYFYCDTMRVNFVNDLAVNITPVNPVICFGGPNVTVTANVSGGLAPFNYLWNTGATTQSITVGPGTYSVILRDSMNCSIAYDTVLVTGVPSMIIANAGPDNNFCTNDQNVTLAGSVQTATGGIWIGGNGNYSPGNTTLNAVYTPSAAEITAGVAHLQLVTTGNFTCPADTDDVYITIYQSPAPSITGNTNVCEYSSQVYTAPLVNGITYNWVVSGGTITSNNTNSITVSWNAAGSGSVMLTETRAGICDSTVTINVVINPRPVPAISGPATVCTSTTSQYTITTPAAQTQYAWTVTGGTIVGSANGNTINVSWSAAGSATIAVLGTNNFGCTQSVQIPVSVLVLPTPSISGAANGCAGQSITYSTSVVSANTYAWTVTGGTITSQNNNTITVYWPSATTGTVTLTESNTLSCAVTVSLSVVVGPQPAPVLSGPGNVCTTTTTAYSVSNPVAGNFYSWNVTGGIIMGSAANSSVQISWPSAGQGTVTVTQSNSYGCDSTVSIPVNIYVIPAPFISGVTNACAGQTLTYSTNPVAGNTYNWTVNGGTVLSNANTSITVLWPSAVSGSVTLTESNTLTCDSTVTLNVSVGLQPAPQIVGAPTVCTTTTTTYTVSNPVAGNSYNWTVTGGVINGAYNTPSINVSWYSAGSAIITLYESNASGCDSTVQFPVNIITKPAPFISGVLNACAGQTLTYTTNLVQGNTYSWNVNGGTLLAVNNNSITVFWPSAVNGSVTLTESNTATCDSTVTINVIVGLQPAPLISGPQTVCTTTTSTYSAVNPVAGNSYNWTVTGGVINGAFNTPSITVTWYAAGSAMVTLYESNSSGCDSMVQIPVTIFTLPSPVITGISNACAGQTITYTTAFVTGNTYTWNVSGGTMLSTSVNSVTVNWPVAVSGSVSVTEANTSACVTVASLPVIVGPQPAPVILGSQVTCTTTITNYNLANPNQLDTYSWTVTGGVIVGSSTGTNVQVQWLAAGAGSVSVVQSNSFGCDSLVSFPVNILEMPAPAISGSPNVCAGEIITYTTPLVAGNTYSWNVTGGSVISVNNNTITVQWPVSVNGTITLTEANTFACDSTIVLTVQVGIQPAPVLNGPPTVCTTTTTPFSIVNPVAGNTYSWLVNGGTITGAANGSTINILWSNPGSGTVTVTQSNSAGCDSTVSLPVTILTIPAPSISGPSSACAGQTITYSTPLVQGNTYAWNVTGGTIISNSVNSIQVLWPAATNGSVTLTESNTSACDSTVSLTVITGLQPAPVVSGPTVICTAEFSSYAVAVPIGINTYNWTVTGGTITGSANATGINVLWNAQGMQTITLTEANSSGCDSTITFLVDVRLKPAPSLTGQPISCEMDTATYSVQNMPGHSYFWNVTGGSIVGTAVGNSIQVLWTGTGSGMVEVRVVSPLGCDSTVSRIVGINPLPVASVTGPAVICDKESAIYFTNSLSGYTYSWSVNGAAISGSSTSSAVNISFGTAGQVNMMLTATTANGCSLQLPYQVLVNPKPIVQVTGVGTGCISSQVYTFSTYPQFNVSYQWSVAGGNIISGNNTPTITVKWTTPGFNSVSVTATNTLTGCDSSMTIPVLVDSLAAPVISAASLSGCTPVVMNFMGNSLNPSYHYVWHYGDGSFGTGPNPVHQYTIPGTYPVQLIATNNTGCADTVSGFVTVFPTPQASFNTYYGTGIYYATLSTLTLDNYSTGANQYSWNFGNGDTSSLFEPYYQYESPGDYTITLTVANQYGCVSIATAELEVKVPEQIYIPNAFTPNNDMLNDFFSVSAMNITSLQVAIFNRWGQSIYHSDSPSFKWDGTYNGNPAAEGVYVYSIDAIGFHGDKFQKTGTVTLVR